MIFSSIKFLCLTSLLSIVCFLARAAGPVAEPVADVMTSSGPNNNNAEEASPAEEEDSSSDEGEEEDPAAETSDESAEVEQETDQDPDIDSQPSEETEEGQESTLEDPLDLPGEPSGENEGPLTESPSDAVNPPMATEVSPSSMDAGEDLIEASFPENAPAPVVPSVDASSMIAEPDSEVLPEDPEQGLEEGEDSEALGPEPFTAPPRAS